MTEQPDNPHAQVASPAETVGSTQLMPEAWLQQIREVCKTATPPAVIGLPPEPPEAWLTRISNACKPTISPAVSTLLGSALLAAVIAGVASYITATMTIKANLALESQKANLQLQQDKARAQIKAYQTLALRLDELHGAFYSYIVLGNRALQSTVGSSHRPELAALINQIGVSQRNLIDAKQDTTIAASQVCKDIDEWLAKFTPGLARAATDPGWMLQYASLDASLLNLSVRARQEADRVSIPTR